MMYLLLRLLLFIFIEGVIIVAIFLIRKKRKIKRLTVTGVLIFPVILFFISLYFPFESCFLRFNTLEESLKYSTANTQVYEQIAVSDCTFIIYGNAQSGEHLGVVNRYDDKWGMLNENVKIEIYKGKTLQLSENGNGQEFSSFTASSIFNKSTNQSMVVVNQIFKSNTNFFVPVISPENEMFAYDIKQTDPNFSIARNLKIEPFEVKESYEVYLGGLAREEYVFEKAF
ncbi:MAG TPA: hypothetical protein IAD34_00330 [Candidatus Scatovicinus merdipullorum]|nr:hypothetical protein [Candidatus Scatovicinus merdipullorum]